MRNVFDITGRLALVTGSSRGLGRALATGLAEAGARVVLHGRDADALARVRDEIAAGTGTAPVTAAFDLTDAEAVR
ncbi:SDR family NAD(P)-dependent oxidoreductase, partial [Streptococcus pneumoniae]|nr:SDR family NAD(P)-dependent oxidoreductase [Streptococcus pneumoniae]